MTQGVATTAAAAGATAGAATAAAPDARTLLEQDARRKPPFIAPRLMTLCLKRTQNKARAEDAMSEATLLTLVGEGWHAWTYSGEHTPEESLLLHLCNVAKDVLKKERERVSTQREVQVKKGKEPDVMAAAPEPGERSPSSEKMMTDERRVELVMSKLDDDARAMLAVQAEAEDNRALEPKEVAEKLGWSVKQVHRARERVFYRRDELRAQEAARAARKKGGAA